MKNIFAFIITVIFILQCLVCNAQNTDNHLKFMGISMGMSYENFTSKLKEKGFEESLKYSSEKSGFFDGTFATKNCLLVVQNKNIVHAVKVCYDPVYNNWGKLKYLYQEIKGDLTKKYGKPSNDFEFFSEDYTGQIEDNDDKMRAVGEDKCNYSAFFKTEKGIIWCEITGMGYYKGFVIIIYQDFKNFNLFNEKYEKQKMNDY